MSIDAMKQALHTLEGWANHGDWVWPESALEQAKRNTTESITALRAAIEQAQEPVAWMHNFIEGNVVAHRPADLDKHPDRWKALYKTPPSCPTCEALARAVMMDQTSHDMAPRQWQGLTEAEKVNVAIDCGCADVAWMDFADAIEAKLKEKNT